jgi:hypothetical protein
LQAGTALLRIFVDGAYLRFCGAPQNRKGIDSLARLCQEKLAEDPFSGCVFVFRSRRGTAIRLLSYDGQGYWLAQKRFSQGKIRMVAGIRRGRQTAGSLRGAVVDGGRGPVACAGGADVAAAEPD